MFSSRYLCLDDGLIKNEHLCIEIKATASDKVVVIQVEQQGTGMLNIMFLIVVLIRIKKLTYMCKGV